MVRSGLMLVLAMAAAGSAAGATRSRGTGAAAFRPSVAAACARAAAYSQQTGGTAMLVVYHGKRVFEQYAPGVTANTPHRLASGTKSFWGVAAACMVQDGLLKFTEKAADTLTAWRGDPVKSRITIRQLLSLSSGLRPAFFRLHGIFAPRDKYAFAVNQVQVAAWPGTRFSYGPASYYAFGAVIKLKLARATGEDPLQYLKRRVFKPIGLTVAKWTRDGAGDPQLPNGAYLTARQWAKFGELIVNAGKWHGKTIVDPGLLAQVTKPSPANPAYGMTFWLNQPRPWAQATYVERVQHLDEDAQGNLWFDTKAPRDMVIAAGAGRQRLYMIPSMGLVIVRQGEGKTFRDCEFLERVLPAFRVGGSGGK